MSTPETATSLRRVRKRRVVVGGLLTVLALVATALPAFGHASFPAAAGFGFQPNTSGGTGLPGSTPPYEADATVTIYSRVPFEQTDPFNGSDDTTVDVKIIVPAGWTDATCGAAKKQVNNDSTAFTNQPGDDVAGWSCETYVSMGHTVIHWWGPQVVSPVTSADSAQFFLFSVTTPSPSVQTTYNGLDGTEGYIVDQVYASGETEHWIPNAAYTGNPPPGSETIVATGLVRTVAAFVPVEACGEGNPGPFPDVPGLHPFCEDIDWMSTEGIAGGFDDGTFRPGNPVSRQAMAAFLYRYAGEPAVGLSDPFFADVPESSPFYDAIQWMAETGLSTGTPNPPGDPLYNPTAVVSRQAMAAFLYRNAGEPAVGLSDPFFADVAESSTFYTPVQWMAETELSTGTPNPPGEPLYKPVNSVTRQAMSAFLHRYDGLPA